MSIRSFSLVLALFAGALAVGCGGGSGSDSGEVSVKTGSLSKAAFIGRADAICTAARNQFTREYTAFGKKNKPPASTTGQIAWIAEIVETILLPSYENRMEEIGALGAPSGDEKEVSEFLNAFNERLEEIKEKPVELSASPYPFAKAAKLAKAYGLNGCASSFG